MGGGKESMSTTIDSKVVQMRFDNANFERNVNQSISTLDKLKHALKLDGAADSFQEIGDSAGKMHLDNAIDESDRLGKSFNALEQIGIGVFRRMGEMITENVTNKLINTAKELSGLNNAIAGYGKYEQKTNAMQIMQSALPDLDLSDIEEKLETLNWFSDETSYGFTDMTDALSKFVAAGQKDLDKDVTAIQGIATWAASAGVNARDASRAFYNLAQAMGLGALTSQDWKSIELLNMGTYEFKEVAIAAGLATGTLEDVGDAIRVVGTNTEVTAENFRETLKEKWLDTDTMMTVFGQYGEYATGLKEFMDASDGMYDTASQAMVEYDKQLEASGESTHLALAKKAFEMAQVAKTFGEAIDSVKDAASTTWMNIIQDVVGDLDQAKELWTNVANKLWDIFVGPLANLEEIMSEWSKGGGRDNLLTGLTDGLKALGAIANAVITPIKEIFGSLEAWQLLKWSSDFKNAMVAIQPSESTLQSISNVVRALTIPVKFLADTLTKYVWPAVKTIFGFMLSVGGGFIKLLNGIISALGSIGSAFSNAEIKGSGFRQFFNNLLNTITIVGNKIKNLLTAIGAGLGTFGTVFALNAEHSERFNKLVDVINRIKDAFTKLFSFLTPNLDDSEAKIYRFTGFFANLASQILGFSEGPVNTFISKLGSIVRSVKELAENSGVFKVLERAGEHVKNFFKSFAGGAKDTSSIDDINDKLKISDTILDKLSKVWDVLKNGLTNAFNVILNGLKRIWDLLGKVWDFVYGLIGPIIDNIIAKFKEIGTELQNGNFSSALGLLVGILSGGAIAKLFGILKDLKGTSGGIVDTLKKVKKSITEITESVTEALGAMTAKLKAEALSLIAKSILLLVASLIAMSFVDDDKVAKTTLTLVVLMEEMSRIVKSLGKTTSGSKSLSTGKIAALSTVFVALAGAVLTMSLAIALLSFIKPEKLETGLLALSAMIGLMGAFVKLVNGTTGDFKKLGKGLKLLASSLIVMTLVVWLLGSMDKGKLDQGTTSLVLMMGIITIFAKLNKNTGNFASVGKSLKPLLSSIIIMTAIIYILGSMDPDKFMRGSLALGIMVSVITLFGIIASNLKIKSSGNLAKPLKSMLGTIIIMTGIIYVLGSMDPDKFIQGGLALTMMIAVIALFSILVSNGMNGNNKNLNKLGRTLLALSIALVIIAAAIKMLSGLDPDGMMASVMSLSIIMLVLAGFIAVVKSINGKAGAGIAVLILALGASMIFFAKALNQVAGIQSTSLLKAVLAISALLVVITASLVVMSNFHKGINRLSSGLLKMSVAIAVILAASALFMIALKELIELGPDLVTGMDFIWEGILRFAKGLEDNLPTIAENILVGIAGALVALRDHLPELAGSLIECVAIVLDEVRKALPGMLQDIKDMLFMVMDFIVGDVNLEDTYGELGKEGASGLESMTIDGTGAGRSFMDSLGDGIKKGQPSLLEKLSIFLGKVLDTVYTFIKRETTGFISFLVDEFIIILNGLADKINERAEDISAAIHNLISALMFLIATFLADFNKAEWFTSLIGAIKDMCLGLIDKAKEFLQPFFDWFEEKWNAIKGFFADMTGRKAQYDDFFENDIIKALYTSEQLERGRQLMEGKIASSKWTDEDRRLVNDLTAYMNGDAGFDKTYIIRDGKIVGLSNNYGGLKGWEVEDLKAQGQTFEYDELLAELAKGATAYSSYEAAKAALDALNPQHYAYENQSQRAIYDKSLQAAIGTSVSAMSSLLSSGNLFGAKKDVSAAGNAVGGNVTNNDNRDVKITINSPSDYARYKNQIIASAGKTK